MKNKETPRSRQNSSPRQASKVPLTYYRSRSKPEGLDSPFVKKEPFSAVSRMRNFLGRLIDGIVVLVIIVGLIYSLLVSGSAKVQASSTIYHPASVYQAAAQKYVGSFTNRNKITFNGQAIATSLQKQFPEIQSVNVELPILSQTPVVHLNIAKPSLVLNNNDSSYVVDSAGVAVAQATTDQSNQLITIVDHSGFVAKKGQQAISADAVQFITNLVAQLNHANVPVKSLSLPAQAEELDLYTKDQSYYVKFYLGGDVLQEAGQFLAARHNFTNTHQQPSQYLDVRVAGRVYYK